MLLLLSLFLPEKSHQKLQKWKNKFMPNLWVAIVMNSVYK